MTLSAQDIATGRQNANIGTELVLNIDAMRVWHLRLAPGETIPTRRHDRPYFWTIVTNGQGISQFGDGRVVPVAYKAGDTGSFPGLSSENYFAHDLTNTGDTDLIFVTVELSEEGTNP